MIYLLSTMPHNLIKEKLTESIEHTFNREDSIYWLVMRNAHFFKLLNKIKDLHCGHVRKFVTKLRRVTLPV